MRFVLQTLINALALWVATALLGGMDLVGDAGNIELVAQQTPTVQRVIFYIVVGAVLALVNMVVRPIVKFLSFPFYVLTLGLFFVVVNALMILLTEWITSYFSFSLAVDGFWWALIAGIVIGLVNWVLGVLVKDER